MTHNITRWRTARGWAGLLFNPSAWWIGAHYSRANARWCVNIVPCFTLWFCPMWGRWP